MFRRIYNTSPEFVQNIYCKVTSARRFSIYLLALSLIVLLILHNPSYSEDKEVGKPGRPTLEGRNLPPSASINATATAGNAPLTVQFTGSGSDRDGSIVSYHWDFGDGTTSEQQTASHIYETVGTYVVTLTVKDDLGATGTAELTVAAVRTAWMPS